MNNRTFCRRGHDLTEPHTREADGSCVNCLARDAHLAAAAGRKRPPKKAARPIAEQLDEQWRQGRLQELTTLLGRNPMPWERETLEREFAQLVAKGDA